MRKTKTIVRFKSAALTEDDRARLSELTAKRLFQGHLSKEDAVERERLRLRLVATREASRA